MDIRKIVKPSVRALTPYEAKEVPCRVKLDANESPYGLSPEVLSGIRDRSRASLFTTLNRYPDPRAKKLIRAVARYFGANPLNILHGNGSDELIYYLITTFGGPVLYPVPTFSMYGIISRALGEEPIEVPLDQEFDLDLNAVLRAARTHKPKLIFLSSPNNPTGNCFSSEKVLRVIEASAGKSVVIVDEAYHAFAGKRGILPMCDDYENLVVLRTLSKIGLAGLRIGFMIARQEVTAEVNKVRLPFNLNSLSQSIAVEVLKDRKTLRAHIKEIVTERDLLFREMQKIDGIVPYPSEANFILFRAENSEGLFRGLLDDGILVRNMKGAVLGCLRVTVGRPNENRMFLRALRKRA
jgi:histidinol-phosphate aminotransferase